MIHPRWVELKSQVKLSNFRIMKAAKVLSAVTLISAALLFAVAHAAIGSGQHSNVAPDPSFTITNTISSSPTSQIGALLYPGVTRYLWYTAHNPSMVPITVTSMSIPNVDAPAGCPVSILDDGQTMFRAPPTNPLFVPAHGMNVCQLPTPPASYHGTAAAYFHYTITNCTVETL